MKTTLQLVSELIKQDPAYSVNPKHLMLAVWDKQGLRLHPMQRDKFLSDAVTTPATISRAMQKVRTVEKNKVVQSKRK